MCASLLCFYWHIQPPPWRMWRKLKFEHHRQLEIILLLRFIYVLLARTEHPHGVPRRPVHAPSTKLKFSSPAKYVSCATLCPATARNTNAACCTKTVYPKRTWRETQLSLSAARPSTSPPRSSAGNNTAKSLTGESRTGGVTVACHSLHSLFVAHGSRI